MDRLLPARRCIPYQRDPSIGRYPVDIAEAAVAPDRLRSSAEGADDDPSILNQGNLHAFLAQGNVTKLSLERAYELVDYLEAA